MLLAIVTSLALFGGHATIHKTQSRVAGWTLSVRKDNFTGAVTCSARKGDIALQGGVVSFALGADVDTSDAVYRLNAGEAHSVHDVALRVRVLGAPITVEPIDNPSRGLVLLPAADVVDTQTVWIRAAPRAAPRRFITAGLDAVIAQERIAACA